ncbi:MAG: aminotransferase class V-fold PLP-dependent enzyme [Clostridia bacterium]|nr:aminotransferase class V-fold PLP-dependent enzyme [Clostridia bacterium]
MTIYLDNAATTFPKPPQVLAAVNDCISNYCANPGRSGHKLALRCGREVYNTREMIAGFFNIEEPLRVIFTSNATEALNLALKGSLCAGDHVVTTTMEHNSVLRPLSSLQALGVEHTIVECSKTGVLDLNKLEAAILPNTKMLAVTHCSNLIGSLNPAEKIGQICRRHNLLFLLDAAQSAGIYGIDVAKMNIDLLAAPGHKGLFGLQGTGFLYVSPRCDLREIKQGGTGSRSEQTVQPQLFPDRYESGTLNLPGIVSLGTGIKFINSIGIKEIREHEQHLGEVFLEKILNIDGLCVYGEHSLERRAPVFAVNLQTLGSSELAAVLDDEYEICTRGGLHCAPLAHTTIGTLELGAVRFSLGYFNTKAEIDKAAKALEQIYKNTK